jgi:hypothetical protein
MTELKWDVETRVGRVREIAARVYCDVQGESLREAMHALALATAAVIRTSYSGRGIETALEHHISNVRHHARKGQ